MRCVVDPRNQQTKGEADRGKCGRSPEEPAEIMRMKVPSFPPDKNEKGSINPENCSGRTAGNGESLVHHQGQEVSRQSTDKVDGCKAGMPIHSFHQLTPVPQRPHVQR